MAAASAEGPSFGVRKFLSFIPAGTFAALTGFVLRLTDAVVLGHVIGEDALAGVNLVTPLLMGFSFVAGLIGLGTANTYAHAMGRLDRDRAHGFFVQGFACALVVGGFASVLAHFAVDGYLALLNGSEYVEMYARQYMGWYAPLGVLECVMSVLIALAYVDGDRHLCLAALGAVFVVNAAVSYPAVQTGMGAAGAALGTVVAETVGCLVLCAHFFRATNSFRFVARFSLRELGALVHASFGGSVMLLLDAALVFFVARLVIVRFDSDLLPVAGVALVLWQGLAVFGGVAQAVQPLVAVAWGERNPVTIRRVMKAAVAVLLIEAILLGGVLALFPETMVGLVGIEFADLTDAGCRCVRILCLGFVPIALLRLFAVYFLTVERSFVALALTLVSYGAIGVFAWTFSSVWGLAGLWAGLAAGPAAGLALLAGVVLWKGGRAGFPLLLTPGRDARLHVIGLRLTEEEIVAASVRVSKLVPASVASRAALLVEEVFMTVREHTAGRELLGEVTLDLNDGVVLVLRDDGPIFDITDSDRQVSSLRTFLVASLMERQPDRINLVTSGFNRNVFRLA